MKIISFFYYSFQNRPNDITLNGNDSQVPQAFYMVYDLGGYYYQLWPEKLQDFSYHSYSSKFGNVVCYDKAVM